MGVNRDKPDRWKGDIIRSVDMYNRWFMKFAPRAFRKVRTKTAEDVEATLKATNHLTNIRPQILRKHPAALPTLRMSTCPPIAVDRLAGLAKVPRSMVQRIERKQEFPARMSDAELNKELAKIGSIIRKMADSDIFVWLGRKEPATRAEIRRAATIVADRLCGAVANPIIRNAQEERQLTAIAGWLKARGYRELKPNERVDFDKMKPGTFSTRLNVPVRLESGKSINMPLDMVVMPKDAKRRKLPILIEAKSAGDFANVNKRRKEEAVKMQQLRKTYGSGIRFNLFLCGYFDSGYLGYEAAESIDWVWEHRMDDLAGLGL